MSIEIVDHLVIIKDGLMLNRSNIAKVQRCGNYTEVWEPNGRLHQVWDEDESLWNKLGQPLLRVEGEKLL
ncbi:MAG: hypothetical protein AAF571_12695 [Verrucomicrobiota bacterium]